MNFLQHIQEIDKRIEERKEEEYQKTLFGLDGDMEVDAGLAFSSMTYTQTMPMGNGATARITNGRLTSVSQSIPGGGRMTYRY